MLKKVSNLGKTLSKDEQKTISGGGLCDLRPGSFPCYCNGVFAGCAFSVSYCVTILCGGGGPSL